MTNEVLYLDLETGRWRKPGRVFVDSLDDMPKGRMGASIVNYLDKLYMYGGADPYASEGQGEVYSDFFSFNTTKGLWKREQDFAELKSGPDGALLGRALRMYNSDAVIFSGGCNSLTSQCAFGSTKSILFE